MSNTIIFSALAEVELRESYEWYEEQQVGVGEKFLSQIESAISAISNRPNSYPIKVGLYRQYVVSRFPYVIVYEFAEEQNLIYILHIFHTSQDPAKKLK